MITRARLTSILASLEPFGIDTQPMRDLIFFLDRQPERAQGFLQYVGELETVISLTKPVTGVHPVEICKILEEVHVGLQAGGFDPVLNTQPQVELAAEPAALPSEVVSLLKNLHSEIQALKSVPQQVIHQHTLPEGAPITGSREVDSMGRVFINPIDNKKVEAIKPSVSIEAKEGSGGFFEKLKRLKSLKNPKP